jgi:UDP-2,3-diacylglucosamine hydrolase
MATISRPHDLTSRPSRIGILAGGGRLPLTIAESVIARGGSIHIVAIEGEADADIARFPHTWVNWGQVGRMVATLRSQRVDAMVIAGSVRRPNLWKVRPDWGFFLSLPIVLGMKAGGDDSVLSRVVRFFESKGIEVRGAHEVAPDLLAGAGPAGAVSLGRQARADAELGFAVRAALGPLDAGQAVVVANGAVLAIEGAEGTDAMLKRVAELSADGEPLAHRGVLAKGPKPGQELRVDMPAIGPRTVELAATAGLAGLAVQAGAVLLLDRGTAISAADAHGIALEGLPQAPHAHPVASAPAAAPAASDRIAGRLRPDRRGKADMEKGLTAVARLAPFETGQSVVVARAYILTVAAAESVLDMLARARELRQWGDGADRRVGVLALRSDAWNWTEFGVETLLGRAAAAGLAGIAVAGPAADLEPFRRSGANADRHSLFLVMREDP